MVCLLGFDVTFNTWSDISQGHLKSVGGPIYLIYSAASLKWHTYGTKHDNQCRNPCCWFFVLNECYILMNIQIQIKLLEFHNEFTKLTIKAYIFCKCIKINTYGKPKTYLFHNYLFHLFL